MNMHQSGTLMQGSRIPCAKRQEVIFRAMVPSDVPRLALQPSQVGRLGIFEPVRDEAHGAELVAAGPAWAAERDGQIICLAGFAEVYPRRQAVAWALLSAEGIGAAHFKLRAFMRARIAEQPFRRIEAIARAMCRPELAWLEMLGFEPAAMMRAWGPLSEDHVLFEIVRSAK